MVCILLDALESAGKQYIIIGRLGIKMSTHRHQIKSLAHMTFEYRYWTNSLNLALRTWRRFANRWKTALLPLVGRVVHSPFRLVLC